MYETLRSISDGVVADFNQFCGQEIGLTELCPMCHKMLLPGTSLYQSFSNVFG